MNGRFPVAAVAGALLAGAALILLEFLLLAGDEAGLFLTDPLLPSLVG